ncbi:hypothetical protein RAH57_03640 [Chryseobacterium sp. CKR4-1]|uniref:hypothetical protein n=1 Tax=Chryseobacterium sp. CKR4-1 TaxID=3068896 RepID=UPI0027964F43|nr:hypothetical protein [Chryseobacterium sp. CKR4-1]MDQ1803063.1 hypothetical protein [Chryseobacterium sp. CKR4-1]
MQKMRQAKHAKRIVSDEELLCDDIRKRGKEMKEPNIIFGYYALIDTLHHPIMNEIALECDWPISKYHRKRKSPAETVSNAEKEKIIEILTNKKKEFDKNFELFIASANVDKSTKKPR